MCLGLSLSTTEENIGGGNDDYRPLVYATPADSDDDEDYPKGYPNGIRVTFSALWQRWAHVGAGDERPKTSASEFAEVFQLTDVSARLADKYRSAPPAPGAAAKTDAARNKKAGEEFQKFGGSIMTTNKTLNLSYMALRRAAIVTELPVGLFILFTNLISKERRSHKKLANGESVTTKEELLSLISKIELFAKEARSMVEEAEEGEDIFFTRFTPGAWIPPATNAPKDGEEGYIANLDALRRLRDGCKVRKD